MDAGCGILVPLSEIEPCAPFDGSVDGILTTGLPGKSVPG